MATAQVESATAALHDEKISEQTIKEPQEEIKNIDDSQEKTTVPAGQLSDDQLPKEPAADITDVPEPELAEAEAEPEALAAEVQTKVVLEEEKEDVKINPVDQTAKVAPEPCVEQEAKTETEPAEVAKVEPERKPEPEPEEKAVEKEEVIAAEE